MFKFTSIILITLLAGGCSSQPFVRYKSPTINGNLQINDSAASGTVILLSLDSRDTECRQAVQQVQADEQGGFSLLAEKQQMTHTPLMTHYLDEWNLCAEIQGNHHLLYSNNRYGMGSVTPSIRLRCYYPSRSKNENSCQVVIQD